MSLPLHSVGRHFRTLKDPRRKHRQRYRLLSLVVIALCAVIANCDDWQKVEVFARERREWLATFLDLPTRTPSHDTFERLFDRLDPVVAVGDDGTEGDDDEGKEAVTLAMLAAWVF